MAVRCDTQFLENIQRPKAVNEIEKNSKTYK